MDAIGYSTARAREEMIDIYYDGLIAVKNGMKSATPVKALRNVMKKRKFKVTVDLHLGAAQYIIYTTDLTAEYVELNKGE
jgi:glutamate N-acetyltransferase/amino-acid N-acetyltransferase